MNTKKKIASGLMALALGLGAAVAVPATANATEASDGWYTWETTYTGAEAPTASTITWPQTLVGKGHASEMKLECGVWYQTDRYEDNPETRVNEIYEVIKDGVLSHDGKPEDHKIVKEWAFVYGGDCSQEPTVEYSDWVDGQWECGDTTVTTSRTMSTTTYTWNRATASFDSETTTATENSTRPLTGDEAYPCPVNDEGEDVAAVSQCTADGFATVTTTTTAWTSVDGVKTYGEPVVTSEVVADEGCAKDDEPEAPTPTPVKADPKGFTG